jgi:hypothetical protein
MTEGIPKLLRQRGLIDEDQFTRMEAVTSGKIISVFYELRSKTAAASSKRPVAE